MPAVRGDGIRGLAVFISDIRNCKSKEAEIKRINKELANIRSKFKGDKTLDGYQKKKYVCKLLFIFLLGHDIDFGHMEAVNLLSSNKYSEKQIGYLFISVLLDENNDLMRLIVQSVKNDLCARNPIHVNLALQCIANIGSREMAETFANEIPKLLVNGDTLEVVKQSAALCLLRLLRANPDVAPSGEWTTRIIHLLNDPHLGVVTAAVSLIDALAKRYPDEYKICVSLAVSRLSRIVTASYTDFQDYTYYFVPAPWLTIKLLRLLQNYPPPEDPGVKGRLNECLDSLLNRAQEPPKSKKVQHPNAKNAVLFEAISLIIHMDRLGAAVEPSLLVRACNQLGTFLQHRETNLRYLALESLCLLATSEFSHEAVKRHQETVVAALKSERDISVRQRAVDLLYAMCDRGNAEDIVSEMLAYLESADYAIREEMVLKVAILAEKYASDYSWYVDVILNLIRIAGDYVSEEVWYRVVQIVINRDDVQGYSAKTVFEALQAPACHENMVKVAGYILGEFGNLIAGDSRSGPMVQFRLLHSKYHLCSLPTRCLLLTTYVKFINLFPEIKHEVQAVLGQDSNVRCADNELQQRAVEYLALSQVASQDVLATVLEEMPPFAERESSILAILKRKRPNMTEGIQASAKENIRAAQDILPAAAPAATDNGATGITDLLGLGEEVIPANARSAPVEEEQRTTPPVSLGTTNEEGLVKLALKNQGIIFENDILQVGIKAEFRQSLGRLSVYYGNKSTVRLNGFVAALASTNLNGVTAMASEVDQAVEAEAQVEQTINVEATGFQMDKPQLNINFTYCGVPQKFTVQLPIFLHKFLEGTMMNAEAFFMRWKNLTSPTQEEQRIFKANGAQANEGLKLSNFGFGVLQGVDPNPDNLVGAGILHTKQGQVGLLLRLEPNRKAGMYRLTVRASRDGVALLIVDALEPHF